VERGPCRHEELRALVDDPDAPDPKAPKTTWVHWVVYNIPRFGDRAPQGRHGKEPSGRGARGHERLETHGYGGPCPPIGRHRYFHKLYALDTALGRSGQPMKAALERALQGHHPGQAELVGRTSGGSSGAGPGGQDFGL